MSIGEMPLGSQRLTVHSTVSSEGGPAGAAADQAPGAEATTPWTFDSMYQAYAQFVWRNARRLGVPSAAAEDVMQEVFLVVHRRLAEFQERTSARAWLSAILIRVVRAYWRRHRTKDGPRMDPPVEPDSIVDAGAPTPHDSLEHVDAVRELYAVLSCMNEQRREVFILSELEELTAPEIADALEMNVNTVYFRLRTARKEFERIVLRRAAASRGTR